MKRAILHSEEGTQSESSGVIFDTRFTKKHRNDSNEPTYTYLLTLGMPALPTNIGVLSDEN